MRSNIENFIKGAVDSSISQAEKEFIERNDASHIIKNLQSILTEGGREDQLMKMMGLNQSLDKIDEARIIMEGIRKVCGSEAALNIDFLKMAHDQLYRLVELAAEEQTRTYFDFIKQALSVLRLVDYKIVSYAAVDIVAQLKDKKLLTVTKKQRSLRKTIVPS